MVGSKNVRLITRSASERFARDGEQFFSVNALAVTQPLFVYNSETTATSESASERTEIQEKTM